MPRPRLSLPATFHFSSIIPVRITDVNYGGHVGNDSILSIIHEARMQFLHHYGYTEMDFAGTGMIMTDVSIEFKNELFYGDSLQCAVAISEISKVGFAIYYKLERALPEQPVTAALARTGMVCYDYGRKKITAVPEIIKARFT